MLEEVQIDVELFEAQTNQQGVDSFKPLSRASREVVESASQQPVAVGSVAKSLGLAYKDSNALRNPCVEECGVEIVLFRLEVHHGYIGKE